MPVVGNRYYNDPSIGAAFSNLAAAFAPPSGSDMAGYAVAKAKKAEAQRLADLFSYAQSPEFNQSTFDRLGQASGQWDPSNGYYGVDVGARTSRENNAADNVRALQTNAADNARALQQTQLTNTKDITTSMLAPVGKDATRFVPPSVATLFGVPETQVGVIDAGQGDTVVTPDNRTIMGTPKPLTDSEVKGAILQQLPANDQRNAALAGVDVEQTIGPDGKPIYTNRPEAAGKPVYNKPTNDSATEISKLIAERDALPPNDPNRAAFDQRIQALGRGQQQSAYDQAADKDFAALNTSIFDNAKNAYAERGLYKTVLAAVDNPNVDQGTMANATLGLRKALNAFGVNAGNTAPAELLNALGGQISLKLRNQDGANMPGAMSDADREFLKSMSVSLGNSPEANRLLAQYYLGIQQRAVDLNDLRQDYVARKGRVDEGFRAEMANYLKTADPTTQLRAQLAGDAPSASGNAAAGGTTPTVVSSPEDAMKLPSGTVIQWTENGQTVTGRVP
jgi:hypothetical protein